MEYITLQKHQDIWTHKFAAEQGLLSGVLGKFVKIYHVGSTAIPDLLAKPIIDIALESKEFPPDRDTIEQLSAIGYTYKGEAGVKGRIWFTKGQPREINLHYCATGSEIVKRQLRFRDSLMQDECLRREYELIKLNNCKGKDIDDAGYADAKSDLIEKVIGQ
jgi:GrpB-like predicted nucleotidyltransferase (UPF0157 family)